MAMLKFAVPVLVTRGYPLSRFNHHPRSSSHRLRRVFHDVLQQLQQGDVARLLRKAGWGP